MFFCICICCKMSSFSWQGLDFIGRHFPSFLKVNTSALNSCIFSCVLCSPVCSSLQGEFRTCTELGASGEHGGGCKREGKEVKICCYLFCQFRNPTAWEGRGLAKAGALSTGSFSRREEVPGTPLSPIFPWHIFPH